MKKIIYLFSIALFVACQSDEGRKAHDAVIKAQHDFDSMKVSTDRYNRASTVYQSLLQLDEAAGTNDAHDKLILQIGKSEAEWFFAQNEKADVEKRKHDSIEKSQLDSMKKTHSKKK